jgi:WD40 repeat protein
MGVTVYNAFISYSHTADSTFAAALQSALHRFAKPWYKLRALHIFRDQTNLAVNPGLWSSIRDSLDQSLFLILLASPEAAASPWVEKEADYWISKNGTSHVLLVLTGGTLKWDHSVGSFTPEHSNALPAGLLHSFPEEPLFLDVRWARDSATHLGLHEPRFHEAVLQLACTLHNRPKDELDGADIRSRRHARWLAATTLIAILLIALFALRQTHESQRESTQNMAASLAASSAKLLADSPDRAAEAALLAIESNRLSPSFEANQALRAAASLLPAGSQYYPPDNPNSGERVRDIAFSANGLFLAVGRDDGSTQLVDLGKRKPRGYFTPDAQPAARIDLSSDAAKALQDNDAVASVAFSPDGALLASGARDGAVHIWTIPSGREALRILHAVAVSQVAFHPTSNQLATASDDGHVRIFDIPHAALIADFKCGDKIASTSFSPDGNFIAALSTDGAISIFDSVKRKVLRTMAGGDAGFNLAFSKDSKRLATANGDFAFVWDLATGSQLLKATHAASSDDLTPQRWIVDAAISSDGKFMAYAARGDRFTRVWNIDTGRQVNELNHDSAVAAVAFNADGTKLGTGSYDGTARVWELPFGSELQRTSHAGGAEVVAFSPSGNRFAAGGMDGSLSVSEVRRADRLAFFRLPGEVRSVAFSTDGSRLAIGTVSSHASPLVRIAGPDGNVLHDIEFHGAPVIDKLSFKDPNHVIAQWSDRQFLITIDQPSVNRLPDLRRHERDAAVQARISHLPLPAEPTRLAVNPSATILFTAEDENLQAWDMPSGKRRFSLTASGDIDLIVPNPASTSFATLTHGQLTVWDSATGARLAQLPDMGYMRSAAFSPDGRYLLTGYDERSAALWLWRTVDLQAEACARLTRNLSRAEWARWFPRQRYRQSCPNLPAAS